MNCFVLTCAVFVSSLEQSDAIINWGCELESSSLCSSRPPKYNCILNYKKVVNISSSNFCCNFLNLPHFLAIISISGTAIKREENNFLKLWRAAL